MKMGWPLPKDANGKDSSIVFAHQMAKRHGNFADRFGIRLSDSTLHLQPQSWYIYDSNSVTTCHKPVLFDAAMQELNIHVNKAVDSRMRLKNRLRDDAGSDDNGKTLTRALRIKLRHILRDTYKEDFEMYDVILTSARSKMAAASEME